MFNILSSVSGNITFLTNSVTKFARNVTSNSSEEITKIKEFITNPPDCGEVLANKLILLLKQEELTRTRSVGGCCQYSTKCVDIKIYYTILLNL